MRRACVLAARRGAQVAVYDALLFLMVVILVSTGMFLYSAKISADGPGLTGTTYQRLADAQLAAVLGRNIGLDGLVVGYTLDGTTTYSNLTEVEGIASGPYTVEWALRAYQALVERDRGDNGTWALSGILDGAGEVFNNTTLEGTHFAWGLVGDGSPATLRSDVGAVVTPEDLPGSRWASSLLVHEASKVEVRYYLWLA